MVSPSLFNEDFVNAIGFRQEESAEGRLKSIVLSGEQVENRKEIEDLDSRRGNIEKEISRRNKRRLGIGSKDEEGVRLFVCGGLVYK